MMGAASYLVCTAPVSEARRSRALTVYGLSLAANFLWPILFFTKEAWLLALFLVGACLRRHGGFRAKPWIDLSLFFVFAAATCATYAAKLAWPRSFARVFGPHNPFLGYLSPTTVCSAVFLVRYFASMDIRPKGALAGMIRFFSPAAFGVYLWQTQPVFFSRVFRDSFAFVGRLSVPAMAVALPCFSVAVFVAFAVLERVRMWVFGIVERFAFRRGEA